MAEAPYKLLGNGSFIRTKDGAIIPLDPANNDYAIALAWAKSNKVTPPSDTPNLEEVKARHIDAIVAIANRYLDAIVAGRSSAETLMWSPKAQESEKLLDAIAEGTLDPKTLAEEFPMLFAEAKTAKAMEALAREVLGKQHAMKVRSGQIIGIRTAKKQEIEAIQDLKSAIAYDPSTGWG